MIKIEEYILRSIEERKAHLKLEESCVERGGANRSDALRGLLAYVLDTTIPLGMKIHACHACHNSKCSHPYHLYWGTPYENRMDAKTSGASKSIWEWMVQKYGIEEARRVNGRSRRRIKAGVI